MKTNRLLLFALLAIAALALSACGTQVPVNNWPGLTADAEKAYVASGAHVYAVNLSNGGEAWRYPADADADFLYYANPVLTPDGQLLVGSAGNKHVLSSLNPASGQQNWATPSSMSRGLWLASPFVLNDMIYAPNTDGYLYILRLDGTLVDSVRLGGSLWSTPVSDGQNIYVASLDHHLHVIDATNLESVGTADLGGAIPGGLTLTTDGVYVGTFASRLEFVNINADHQVLAESQGWIWGAPALDGETLYYADLEGYVYSLDLASGRQNWEAVKPNGPIATSPLVIGDQIVVATESGSLVVLDRDGKFQSFDVGGKIYTTPVIANDLLLIAPYQADFALVALTLDGKQAWKFTPAK